MFEKAIELVKKMGNREEEENYEPKQVIDRYLDSLRRQRQVQMNEVEKEQLKKAIARYIKEREKKHLWNLGHKEKKKQLLEKVKQKKKISILKQKRKRLIEGSLLDNKIDEFGSVNILKNHGRFLR